MKTVGKIYLMPAIMLIASIVMFISPGNVYAQTDQIFTQHWALPTLYNPAAAGQSEWLRIRGGARLQWIGIENAPKSFAATADIPFKLFNKRAGAGVTVMQESLGLFSNLLVSAQGSYKLKLLKGELGLGLQIGYYNSRFRGSDVYIPDDDDFHNPDDPSIPKQDLSGNAIDFSLGLYYSNKRFYAGIAGMHLTSPSVKMEVEGSESTESRQFETSLPRTLYFDTGGNIELRNTLFLLQPSLLVASDFDNFSAKITMRATYNRFLSLGVGYRWKDAFSIMVGAEYKNFFLGYAYDYPLSSIAKASSGSHELVAGYSLKIDLSGKNKHKHRSIRIM